ncbi:membrane protein [methanotrophic bacterial endosymbiont of Bathymodiolus sp.]|nr:membrane protein [methanotrophic bacterial endosymbiont of Bathymodiolus sp.]
MAGGFVDTLPFKLTNLLIHIVNSGLLMCLLVLLWPLLNFPGQFSTIQIGLSVLLMNSLWALHPLQVSTVEYVVQRMTSMAATFVLLGAYVCLFMAVSYYSTTSPVV